MGKRPDARNLPEKPDKTRRPSIYSLLYSLVLFYDDDSCRHFFTLFSFSGFVMEVEGSKNPTQFSFYRVRRQ
jgi:hypothetical protein